MSLRLIALYADGDDSAVPGAERRTRKVSWTLRGKTLPRAAEIEDENRDATRWLEGELRCLDETLG